MKTILKGTMCLFFLYSIGVLAPGCRERIQQRTHFVQHNFEEPPGRAKEIMEKRLSDVRKMLEEREIAINIRPWEKSLKQSNSAAWIYRLEIDSETQDIWGSIRVTVEERGANASTALVETSFSQTSRFEKTQFRQLTDTVIQKLRP